MEKLSRSLQAERNALKEELRKYEDKDQSNTESQEASKIALENANAIKSEEAMPETQSPENNESNETQKAQQ